jgi:dTDP-4-dehydrorhamnose 3,5-epimerase-like enzyme
MKALIRTIDNKVTMEAVELTAEEIELGIKNKIQYTDKNSKQFYFVYEFSKGFVTSQVFQGN